MDGWMDGWILLFISVRVIPSAIKNKAAQKLSFDWSHLIIFMKISFADSKVRTTLYGITRQALYSFRLHNCFHLKLSSTYSKVRKTLYSIT